LHDGLERLTSELVNLGDEEVDSELEGVTFLSGALNSVGKGPGEGSVVMRKDEGVGEALGEDSGDDFGMRLPGSLNDRKSK
jgi:hypothetical protein